MRILRDVVYAVAKMALVFIAMNIAVFTVAFIGGIIF